MPQAATSKAASKDLISEALPKALPGFQAGGVLAPTRPARASKSPGRRVWYTFCVWSIYSPGRPGRARRVGSGNGSPKLAHPAASAPQSAWASETPGSVSWRARCGSTATSASASTSCPQCEGCLMVGCDHGPQAEVAQGVGPGPLVEL